MTIDELTSEQIRDPEVYQKIKDLGDAFVRCVQAKEAWSLQDKLNSLLKTANLQNFNPELQKEYNNLLIALKWTALPLLPEKEALNALSNHYLAVLDNEDIDTRERIEAKMFTLDLFPRNELRQKMHAALKENEERLGSKTFGEWLLDYSKTFDFKDRDELTPTQYIRQNPEAQTLPEAEKNKLRKALCIFDQALLVTPVMDEFSLGLFLREMIKAGTIKREDVNPTLLRSLRVPIEKPEVTRILTEAAAKKAAEKPAPPEKPKEKPEKPGFFKKLFGKKKKKKKLKEKEEIEEIEEKIPEEITSIYEGKISPYEKERGVTEEIPTFPKEVKKEVEKPATAETQKEEKIAKEPYQIRTMKQDIKKAKKKPIPEKPKPRVKNNIVDLSGK